MFFPSLIQSDGFLNDNNMLFCKRERERDRERDFRWINCDSSKLLFGFFYILHSNSVSQLFRALGTPILYIILKSLALIWKNRYIITYQNDYFSRVELLTSNWIDIIAFLLLLLQQQQQVKHPPLIQILEIWSR